MSENNNMDTKSLHVPQSTPARTSNRSIMDAYNSQSKIALYDESSGMSCNDLSGVKGKDIPLAALRPKTPMGIDENGKPVYSKSSIAADIESRNDIRKAYMKMQGVDDEDQQQQTLEESEIEYIEDVPDDNEGILNYLETCINNARANLEMLESLYAALRG